jgi:hypothetical protein
MGLKSGSALPRYIRSITFVSVIFLILLAACTFQPSRSDPQSQDLPVFVAPTIVVIQAVTQQTTLATQLIPTAAPTSNINPPDCLDDLKYIEDLNFTDFTKVTHGSIIQKQWLVENTGTCTWTSGYTVRHIDGPAMSANPSQALTSAVPASQVTIVITFIAPTQPGEYKSSWQAFNPSGQSFGKPFYIDIIVSP